MTRAIHLAVELPASDKVDDLEAVAGLNQSFLPASARQDFQVALDGHAFRAEFQVCQQEGDVQPRGNFLRLAINLHLHRSTHFAGATGAAAGFFGLSW